MKQILDQFLILRGFILVYPQALEDPNDDNSTNWLHKEPTDHKDIFFVEALIDTIATQYNIDTTRVYACGYSLGGMFSYELACQLNHKIAAISSVAGAAFLGAFSFCGKYLIQQLYKALMELMMEYTPMMIQMDGIFLLGEIDSFWATSNNTDISPIITQVADVNMSDGSQVERHSWINGDGCVAVRRIKNY